MRASCHGGWVYVKGIGWVEDERGPQNSTRESRPHRRIYYQRLLSSKGASAVEESSYLVCRQEAGETIRVWKSESDVIV